MQPEILNLKLSKLVKPLFDSLLYGGYNPVLLKFTPLGV